MTKRTKTGVSPAAQMRQRIVEAVTGQPKKHYNIWLVKSGRMNFKQWVLTSDPEQIHFHFVEFDPEVISFDLDPPSTIVRVGKDDVRTKFDAIVELTHGRRELREVKLDRKSDDARETLQEQAQAIAAEALGGKYVRIYASELMARSATRYWNSVRLLRFLVAAETHPLQKYVNGVTLTLAHKESETIGNLAQAYAPEEQPLVIASISRLLADRAVLIDLDIAPVSERTVVRAATAL